MTESEQCCVILSLFGQGLGYLIFTYKTKTLAVLCIELIIAPSKNLSLSHAPRKWRRQPGERRSSGTCKHYFQYFFRYTCSCYTLWLVNCDSWLQYYVIYLASPAQAKKHVERVKPSNTAPFDALTFDILTQETVFQEMGGLRYLKGCSQAPSFSLPAVSL